MKGTVLSSLALNNSEEAEKGRSRLVCPKKTYIDADQGTKETILSSPGIVGSIVRYSLPLLSIILSLSLRFFNPLVCCFLTYTLNAVL
jgi:hypothetical protein